MAVSVLPVEALRLAHELRTRCTPAELAGIRERVERTSALVSHLTIEERAAVRVPCALLDGNSACGVHEFRPLGCRGWTSFEKAECDRALAAGEPGHSGPLDRVALAAASAATEGLEHALRNSALDAGQYELHAALAVALEDSEAGVRWQRGEPVFAACPRVTSQRLCRANPVRP